MAEWENAPVAGQATEGGRTATPEWQSAPRAGRGVGGNVIGDALSAAGESIMAAGGSVVDAFRGPQGLPDLPEFDAPAPGGEMDTATVAGGLLASMTPGQQRDIIERHYPGAEIESVEADGKSYNIVNWKNPDSGKEYRGYINAPGMSGRDVSQLAGQALAFTPAGRLGQGLSLVPRMLRVGPGTAATSAGLDAAAQAAGAEEGVDPTRTGVTGAVGMGAEALSPMAARVFRAFRGRSGFFNDRTGALTARGQRAAKEAGLGPEDIQGLNREGRRVFAQYPEGGIDPEVGARVARAGEFDIPLSRGQATQNYSQLNAEERMQRGLMGEAPRTSMNQFRQQQQEAVEGASGTVQGRLGGTGASREAEAAEGVMTSTRAAARRLKDKVREAYKEVEEETFAVAPEAAQRLPGIVEESLASFDITPDLTPAATRATGIVGELVDAVSKGDGAKFERYRQRLGNAIGSAANETDENATTRIKAAFDTWMDDAIDNSLFEGNPQALDMLKNARSLRTQYRKQFEQSGSSDTAGKIMQKIVKRAETPEDVVNYIFGQSQLGRNQATTTAVKRLRGSVGEDSDAWRGIKDSAWLRMTRNRQGNWVGGKAFKKNLKELKNSNRSLYNELFNKEEQNLIERFSKAVETTDPPATNPSGTAFGLENAVRYTLRRLGQRESFTKGNVGRGSLLNFAARMRVPMVGDMLSGGAAARTLNVRPPRPRSPAFTAGTTAGARISGEPEQKQEQRNGG